MVAILQLITGICLLISVAFISLSMYYTRKAHGYLKQAQINLAQSERIIRSLQP